MNAVFFVSFLSVALDETRHAFCRDALYHGEMIEVAGQEGQSQVGHSSKYTRNAPYLSTVRVNELLTAKGSEKETRHIEMTLEDGMAYTPGDAVGIVPENRPEAVADVLTALGFRGDRSEERRVGKECLE